MPGTEQGGVEQPSRRDFLKETGLVVGGAAIVSLSAAAGCSKQKTTTFPPSTLLVTPTDTSSTSADLTGTTTATSSTETAPTSSTPPATPAGSGLPAIPTTIKGALITNPGCDLKIAPDRLYSRDHIWVIDQGGGVALIGPTDELQLTVGLVNTCYFSAVGTTVKAGESFGSIEGTKINVDLICPLSGSVLQANTPLIAHGANINGNPYTSGWFLQLKMSQAKEMDALVSPQYYAYLNSPAWVGPPPPVR
jgi:glycine cleavage system H protein